MTITRKQLVTDTDSSYNSSIIFGSMPDYSRIVLLLSINTSSNKGLPIWKLNVPGYLHAFGCSPINQDTAFGLSDDPQKLVDRTPYSDGKYLCYSGRSVNDGWSGSVGPCVIFAGSSTYFIITGEHMGYYITFTPCFGVPAIIAKERFVTESGYTIAVDTSDYQINNANDLPYLIKPGSATWNHLFDGNWQANFPDIDFSKILDLRESHMSFFFDNKEVA